MKSFTTYLFYGLMFFSIVVNAQSGRKYSGLLSHKCNRYFKQNLKDSVKSVHIKMSDPKATLSDFEKTQAILHNDIRRSAYTYFDNFQRIKTAAISVFPDREYSILDHEKAYDYEYNEKDWLEKSKQKIVLKQYFPISNYNLLLKLNQINVPKKDDLYDEGDGKIWKDYSEDIYIYI